MGNPEHVLMSETEIITDAGRHRYWSASEKLRNVEETLDGAESISAAAVFGAVDLPCC